MEEFLAYIIRANKSTSMNIALYGLLAFFVGIGSLFLGVALITIFLIGGGFLVFIVGIIMGSTSAYQITKDILSVSPEKISVASKDYMLTEISDLHFYFGSFNNQSGYGYYTETSGAVEYGINNTISFISNEINVGVTFFLNDENHANAFLQMLYQLRDEGIVFTANGRFFPTFH